MCRLFVVCSPYIYRRSIKSDKNMKKSLVASNFPPTLLFIGRWKKSVRRAQSEFVVTSWLFRHRIENCRAVWRLAVKVPVHPCHHRQIVVDSRAVISRSSDFVTQKSLFLRIVLRLSNNRLAIIVGEREKGKNPLHQRREKKTFVQIDKDCLIVFVFGFCDRAHSHSDAITFLCFFVLSTKARLSIACCHRTFSTVFEDATCDGILAKVTKDFSSFHCFRGLSLWPIVVIFKCRNKRNQTLISRQPNRSR
jgi:hypothetical protein